MGELSLLHGDLKLAELSFQRGRLWERLRLLYLITGQRDKLAKLARIFKVRGETSNLVQVGLIIRDGDIVAETLALAGYDSLAQLARENVQPTDGGPGFSPQQSNWPKLLKKSGIQAREVRQERYRDDVRDTLLVNN